MSKYAIAQPTIIVDQRGMLIPLETLDVTGTGIAVIALARGGITDLIAAQRQALGQQVRADAGRS